MIQTIRRATPLDIGKLLFVSALWGASFIFMSLALRSYGPVTITMARVTLGSLVLLCFCLILRKSLFCSKADWVRMTLIGALNSAVPFFLISWGMQFISSAEAALLMATGTFSALIISHFASPDERINMMRGIGVVVGFCGVLLFVISDLLEAGLGGLRGQIAVIGAGVSYACSSVLTRRIGHLPALTSATGTMVTTLVYMIPLAFLLESPLRSDVETISIFALVMLGVVATAFAFVIRMSIIKTNGAVFMAQVGYLIPPFGVLWSWLFLDEVLTVKTMVSLAIILLGIAISRRGT